MRSDVRLGALLSGGVDSSAVVASMAQQAGGRIKTFSVAFEEEAYDESHYARLVAQRFATDHHELRLRPDAVATMPRLARHYGEPFGDSSALAMFEISELIAQEVKVVLTGDGGDESFGGYERYRTRQRAAWIERIPSPVGRVAQRALRSGAGGERAGSLYRRASRLAWLASLHAGGVYADSVLVFDATARSALLSGDFVRTDRGRGPEEGLTDAWRAVAADHRTDRMMGVDVATYLPGDLLVKLDVATMAHSLEARAPFLDHELMEFAASLPAEFKHDGGTGKVIVKSALRGVLPNETLARAKAGFAVPVARWLRGELSSLAVDLLLGPSAATQAYLKRRAVERLIREHGAGAADHSMRIWVLMMLEMWHREVLTAARPPGDAAAEPPTGRSTE